MAGALLFKIHVDFLKAVKKERFMAARIQFESMLDIMLSTSKYACRIRLSKRYPNFRMAIKRTLAWMTWKEVQQFYYVFEQGIPDIDKELHNVPLDRDPEDVMDRFMWTFEFLARDTNLCWKPKKK